MSLSTRDQVYNPTRQRPSYWRMVLVFIILIALAFGGLYIKNRFFTEDIVHTYQAVFLINGQVYFGKNIERKDGYTILKNVYYLQVINNNEVQGQVGVGSNDKLTLVKLGSEVHGPTDVLYVNDKNILFYEDLRPDSNVLKSIESKSTEIK